MKGKFPAFQFYPDSWLSSTAVSLMSPAEEGAYLRLLCHAWQSEDCGVPDDDSALASLSRLGRSWSKSSSKIRGKFFAKGGRLFNARLLEERQKQVLWREKSAAGGRKSHSLKREQIDHKLDLSETRDSIVDNSTSDFSDDKPNDFNESSKPPLNHPSTTLEPPLKGGCDLVATKCQPTPQPNTDISSSSSFSVTTSNPLPPSGEGGFSSTRSSGKRRRTRRTTEEIRKSLGDRLPWWEAFWGVYPCGDGKNPAMDAYDRKITTRELAIKVYNAAKAYRSLIEQRRKTDPATPVKYAQGWINDERFEDEFQQSVLIEMPKPARLDPVELARQSIEAKRKEGIR